MLVFITKKFIFSNNDSNSNKKIKSDTQIRNHEYKMYMFNMDNCQACQYMLPIYKNIKEKYKDVIDFEEVDVTFNLYLSNKYIINEVPTFIIVDMKDDVIKK